MKALFTILMVIFSINQLFAQSLPHTFSANSAAKAEEVNENFLFLANQFKVNKKTIDCTTDNMTKAIEDGYNHLVINGTCTENLLITSFIGLFEEEHSSIYGLESNKPVTSLTLEGGTQGVWDNTNKGIQHSVIFGGVLSIVNLTVKQIISLNTGGKLFVDNSSLEKITNIGGGSVEIKNSTLRCDSSYTNACVYIEDAGALKMDNVTLTNEGSEGAIDILRSSTAQIKNSTINNSGGEPITVQYNSSLQLEDTTVSSSSAGTFVGFYGYIHLNGGSMTRTSGTPTIEVKGPSIFHIENNGTIADITCDGSLAHIDIGSSSASITNKNGAACQ